MSFSDGRSRLKAAITLLAQTRVPDSYIARRRRLLSTLEECANEMRDLHNDVVGTQRAEGLNNLLARHTPACRAVLEDPGATCICRPPKGEE